MFKVQSSMFKVLSSHVYSLADEIVFQLGNFNLAEVEHACCECSIGFSYGERIAEMLHLACSATCNNRYSERVGKCGESLVGISCLHSVVVHARKENLPGASLFRFFCPTEQFLFCRDASSVKETRPFAILKTGVYGANTYLRAKALPSLRSPCLLRHKAVAQHPRWS